MLNISPIGRNCTKEERVEFSEIDKVRVASARTWRNLFTRKAADPSSACFNDYRCSRGSLFQVKCMLTHPYGT